MGLLSIQIDHHAGTPKHNNYKRYETLSKLGYSSICYIRSKIGWVSVVVMSTLSNNDVQLCLSPFWYTTWSIKTMCHFSSNKNNRELEQSAGKGANFASRT